MLEAEFLEEARARFRRMFDAEHQPGLRTFKEREDRAVEGGDALTRLLLQAHLQGDELAQPVEVHECSQCGRPTAVRESERPPEREVVTRRGDVHYARPERTCTVCRRALFPPRP